MSALNATRSVHLGNKRSLRYCVNIASVVFMLLFLLPLDTTINSLGLAQRVKGFNNNTLPSAITFTEWQEQHAVLLLPDSSSVLLSRLAKRSQPLPRLLSSFSQARPLHTHSSSVARNLESLPQAFNRLAQLTPILLC
jgi:hypothetical protein